MNRLKLGLALIFYFMAIEAKEQLYVCPDWDEFGETDTELLTCGLLKWRPNLYPNKYESNRTDNQLDLMICCYRLERECLFHKLVQSMCAVTDHEFGQRIQLRYNQLIKECKDSKIEVSEQVCARQWTESLSDDMCNRFMPCSLNDPIVGNPEYIESLVRVGVISGVADAETQVFLTVALILMSVRNLIY